MPCEPGPSSAVIAGGTSGVPGAIGAGESARRRDAAARACEADRHAGQVLLGLEAELEGHVLAASWSLSMRIA